MSEQNHLRTEENPRIDKARILKDRLEKKYSERYAESGQSGREKTRSRAESQLSTPAERKVRRFTYSPNPDAFGRMTEGFARYMGTPQFLLWMTVFCGVWLGWNTLAPEELQFDPRSLNFTLLTLMLSLQASYAAPLLLLAQNRQDDRDRVVASEDRFAAHRPARGCYPRLRAQRASGYFGRAEIYSRRAGTPSRTAAGYWRRYRRT